MVEVDGRWPMLVGGLTLAALAGLGEEDADAEESRESRTSDS